MAARYSSFTVISSAARSAATPCKPKRVTRCSPPPSGKIAERSRVRLRRSETLGLGLARRVADHRRDPDTHPVALGLTTWAGCSFGPGRWSRWAGSASRSTSRRSSASYPVAGSVFQSTRDPDGPPRLRLVDRLEYMFAGIITVAAVVATLSLALTPALEGLGFAANGNYDTVLHTDFVTTLITLVVSCSC